MSARRRARGISSKSLHAWIRQYGQPLDVDSASEQELTARVRQQARIALFDYSAVFYNRERLHSGIDYTRPVSRAA